MPVFQPRNRVQILREMVARVVARSKLVGLTRNSVNFHMLAASANEDAEQYVQMARLRALFSIDRATGSDLDERAREILPGTIFRRPALYASGTVEFSRPGTTGTISIPAGSQVSATDAQGLVRFRTTTAASITAGNTTSGAVAVIATEAGLRGNVAAASITKLTTRIAGVSAVTNAAKFTNGASRESDPSFRARIKSFVQAISRGTPTALKSFARNVLLPDGRRVLFADLVEPILPDGTSTLYIDDGTGAIEEFDTSYISSPDLFLASAIGGEIDLYTTEKPIRDDGTFTLEIDTGAGFVTQVAGTDYLLNAATGQVELQAASFPTGLATGTAARASYRYYTGLIRETQRILDGDYDNELTAPGVRAGATQVKVRPPQTVYQSLSGAISVLEGFDPTLVAAAVKAAIQDYINTLGIGENVIVAEIIERAMAVSGMYNISIATLTGSSPAADQVILSNQVARVTSSSINLI